MARAGRWSERRTPGGDATAARAAGPATCGEESSDGDRFAPTRERERLAWAVRSSPRAAARTVTRGAARHHGPRGRTARTLDLRRRAAPALHAGLAGDARRVARSTTARPTRRSTCCSSRTSAPTTGAARSAPILDADETPDDQPADRARLQPVARRGQADVRADAARRAAAVAVVAGAPVAGGDDVGRGRARRSTARRSSPA